MQSVTLTGLFNKLSDIVPEEQDSQQDAGLGRHLLPPSSGHNKQSSLHRLSTSASTDDARSALLTLHMLFPHELLPALDLLDRCLVTRLFLPTKPSSSTEPNLEVFYVQSASATQEANTGRYRSQHATTSWASTYEVHLDSWNCTCPAFNVNAFQCLNLSPRASDEYGNISTLSGESAERIGDWVFGGTARLDTGKIPSCKHVLAAAFVKSAPGLFRGAFREKIVSREEAIAWGSGWGGFAR